jgi:hypothetical protein
MKMQWIEKSKCIVSMCTSNKFQNFQILIKKNVGMFVTKKNILQRKQPMFFHLCFISICSYEK